MENVSELCDIEQVGKHLMLCRIVKKNGINQYQQNGRTE